VTLIARSPRPRLVPTRPELPRTRPRYTYAPATGTSRVCTTAGQLITALADCGNGTLVGGDEIVLTAGAPYSNTGTVFTIPARPNGFTGLITIRTSGLSSLPAVGTRVQPSDAANMPQLKATNSVAILQTAASANASGYVFIGIEFVLDSAYAATAGDAPGPYQGQTNNGIVRFGWGDSTQNDSTLVPRNLHLDRCYIHGHDLGNLVRGVNLNCADSVARDCYFAQVHANNTQASAIGAWNGPGPWLWENCYFEAAAENTIVGGTDPAIPLLVPADLTVRRCHYRKLDKWKSPGEPVAGANAWDVANLFELKNCRRVLVEGCVLEGSWADVQTGYAFNLKSVNQAGGATQSTVQDVTVRYCIVRNIGAFLNLSGHDPNYTPNHLTRIRFEHCLVHDMGLGLYTGDQNWLQIQSGCYDLTIDHCTFDENGGSVNNMAAVSNGSEGFAASRLTIVDSILSRGQFGIKGSGQTEGTNSLNTYCKADVGGAPDWAMHHCMIVGGSAGLYTGSGNVFPANRAAVLFNSDWSLAANSPGHAAASDGSDMGANIARLLQYTAGVTSP
jgi:hypothetical protein